MCFVFWACQLSDILAASCLDGALPVQHYVRLPVFSLGSATRATMLQKHLIPQLPPLYTNTQIHFWISITLNLLMLASGRRWREASTRASTGPGGSEWVEPIQTQWGHLAPHISGVIWRASTGPGGSEWAEPIQTHWGLLVPHISAASLAGLLAGHVAVLACWHARARQIAQPHGQPAAM